MCYFFHVKKHVHDWLSTENVSKMLISRLKYVQVYHKLRINQGCSTFLFQQMATIKQSFKYILISYEMKYEMLGLFVMCLTAGDI